MYIPCEEEDCHQAIPCTYVTRTHTLCDLHYKERQSLNTPRPPVHQCRQDNYEKVVRSNCLGISYTKKLSFSERNDAYYVVNENLQVTNSSKKCGQRFARLTKNEQSSHIGKLARPDKIGCTKSKHVKKKVTP